MNTPAIGLLVLQIAVPPPGADGPGAAHGPFPPLPTTLPAVVVSDAMGAGLSGAGPSGAGLPSPGGTSHWAELDVAARLWVLNTLDELTLEEKVAQLVMAYVDGGEPRVGSARWDRARRLVEEDRVGGLIVGVGSSYGTASWLNRLQGWSAVPLLVGADLEWGPGTRLEGATVLPVNMAVGASGPAVVAEEAGRITAVEARAAGIHMAFAPVADVNVNPDNPVINTRSYGSDPAAVADRVVAFIDGARSQGLLTVVKHFPGHGDTETDSHLEMPVLRADRARLEEVELRPFRAAIASGVDGVMTAHLAVPALDPGPARPATLSPPILTGLLRNRFRFDGLIITDALHMEGVGDRDQAAAVAVEAIQAGADILLMPPDAEEAIDAVVAAVRRGELSEARIDRSVRRVLAAKAVVGLNVHRDVNLGRLLAQVGRWDHEAWGRHVAERSITLVQGRPGTIPLGVRDRSVLAVIYDDAPRHESGARFEAALAERGARLMTVRLSRVSSGSRLERVRQLARDADVVIFASFSRATPWRGSLGLPWSVAALASDLAAAGAPVVSFGDPYHLGQLPSACTYLVAWSDAPASQESAARALLGEIPITGRLPIDLPPSHHVGDGIVVPSLPGITTVRP